MFKLFVTLVRGKLLETGTSLSEGNALPVLAVQIRDAAQDVERARKAVALAMAQEREEQDAAAALETKIAALETRALAALEAGRQELARNAAETIAELENTLAATRQALANISPAVQTLRQQVRQAEMRLMALQRGNRLALAKDSTARFQRIVSGTGAERLQAAEDTLARLEGRQRNETYAAEAYDAIRMDRNPDRTIERLAAAGCGAPLATTAEAVLVRLAERSGQTNV